MEQHFDELVDPAFTARMEERLDSISRGEGRSKPYLRDFYHGNGGAGLKPLVEGSLDAIDPRKVCTIHIGEAEDGKEVVVRVGRYGPYLQYDEQTAPLPDGICPDEVTVPSALDLIAAKAKGEEPIGEHAESGLPVFIKTGRYGPYVQLGIADPDADEKPKMVSLLKGMTPQDTTLETALQLLALPRVVGQDADGEDIVAYNGRYGPYIKRGADTRSLTPDDNLLELSLERALELLAQEKQGRGRRAPAKPLKVFENVKELDGGEIKVLDGRYGPYCTDGDVNASLPKGANPLELTAEQALDLLDARRAVAPKKKKKKAAKKKAAKKATTKKSAAKKPAAKKKAAKKSSAKKAAKKKASKAKPKGDDEPGAPVPES